MTPPAWAEGPSSSATRSDGSGQAPSCEDETRKRQKTGNYSWKIDRTMLPAAGRDRDYHSKNGLLPESCIELAEFAIQCMHRRVRSEWVQGRTNDDGAPTVEAVFSSRAERENQRAPQATTPAPAPATPRLARSQSMPQAAPPPQVVDITNTRLDTPASTFNGEYRNHANIDVGDGMMIIRQKPCETADGEFRMHAAAVVGKSSANEFLILEAFDAGGDGEIVRTATWKLSYVRNVDAFISKYAPDMGNGYAFAKLRAGGSTVGPR
jgi:hypothetical protein